MPIIAVCNSRSRLDELVARVAAGEEILLTEDGKPMARLPPILKPTRRIGGLKDQIWMADDFDRPLDDFAGQPIYISRFK